MENLECLDHLDEDLPDELFFDVGAVLLVLDDLLIQVPVVGEVHNQAQRGCRVLEESLFVAHDVGVAIDIIQYNEKIT